ncbi:MAG: hypothetical protein ACJAU1_001654 [Psychromonas sp.]|jgi:hypothetical protein
MTKPIYIQSQEKSGNVNFTQKQRDSWVRSANRAGMTLAEFIVNPPLVNSYRPRRRGPEYRL